MKRFEFGKNNRDKRNTNNVNNLENSKSKKKISKDIKAKFSNLEIKPQFLIIGLVVIITVISLISVSCTHLDVYKRQSLTTIKSFGKGAISNI